MVMMLFLLLRIHLNLFLTSTETNFYSNIDHSDQSFEIKGNRIGNINGINYGLKEIIVVLFFNLMARSFAHLE